MPEQPELPAGPFSAWLDAIRRAQLEDSGMDVPCGECIACCTSSYFIHIRPEETETLARIPDELLFPAPGLPEGNVLMGYDENGACPMLIDAKCSIYDVRPLTCRAYDCRVFSASGIIPREKDKTLIAERARRWQFSFADQDEQEKYAAVQAAGAFLQEHADLFPEGFLPGNPTQLAVLAVKVCDIFTRFDGDDEPVAAETAKAVVEACKSRAT